MTAHWTTEDAARWRRLIDCAQAVVIDPSRPLGDLERLVDKAWKAAIPTRDETGRADCWRLIKFLRTWLVLSDADQAANREALAVNVVKAEPWITAAVPRQQNILPLRPVRIRRDIDDVED